MNGSSYNREIQLSHIVKKYEASDYGFAQTVAELFEIDDLKELHSLAPQLVEGKRLDQDNEAETYFHNEFYRKLNEGWPELIVSFASFAGNEVAKTIKGPFLCQKTPSFRVHVSKWHYDSDPNHGHPDWEINVQVALTEMKGNSATWIETIPGLGDYKPMNLSCGEYSIFYGNKCMHGNFPNDTGKTRVSFDFRVLPCRKYDGYGKPVFSNVLLEGDEDKYSFVGKKNNPASFYGRSWDTSEGGYYDFFEGK